jgi:hypothetical protein
MNDNNDAPAEAKMCRCSLFEQLEWIKAAGYQPGISAMNCQLCRLPQIVVKMKFRPHPYEFKGDLFECKDSLAHCVSVDLAMSKGIAVGFRDRFGGLDELRSQRGSVGNVVYLHDKPGNRYIYYLITKQNYWGKPTYASLEKCLEALRDLCLKHGTERLAMPRIGCGLDRLRWDTVRASIRRVFPDSGQIQVSIYSLD